ncbi:MAG: T9SS type A sorting domain-containing protein [Candidatus Cloacimonetes bacterium]|nr:T9SS type A sorting domain-containing protein [Candidatus Cloacimonadota bacterium]
MKKMLILLGLTLLVCTLVAEDFMQPAQVAKDSYYPGLRIRQVNNASERDPAPEYSFIPNGDGEDTTYLTSSYYDYMPFSYNGYNLVMQPETSQPYGYAAGGHYVTYMRSETPSLATDRRAFFSYINENGTLGESNGINSDINREGFTSTAVDPYTGDPFSVWHSVVEPDGSYDSHMSYALFHATGSPGSWRSPFILFDNPEMSEPFTGAPDDEFIWPQVWVGPSPQADKRRVHAYGNNYTSSAGEANYNSLYLYADFDDMDLLSTSDLDWTVATIPYFDEMQYGAVERVNKDIVVSQIDGQVVWFGSVGDSLMAVVSDDYGETFTVYTEELKQPLENPTYENDPSTYLWMNDDGITPADMYIVPSNDLSHYNGTFTADHTRVTWMSGVNYNSQENIDGGQYWPAYVYPKIFEFDLITHDFTFTDLDIQGADPYDDTMTIGYDLDEDGEVDEYDADGIPIVYVSCPSWFFNSDGGWQDAYFHESNSKIVANDNWIALVWYDGAKLQNAYYGEAGYDGWLKQPELCLVISDDSGDTWSDIRYINANPNDNVIDPVNHYDGNFAPEFDGMLPVNISLGDKMEIISNIPGEYHAKIHFVFMDDGDYGSAAGQTTGGGDLTNSAIRYAAFDIEFQETNSAASTNDITVTPNAELLGQNYPNPFNPETTIAYNMIEDGYVSIEVFNVKGQKVKTLINEHVTSGDHTLVWEGTNDNNQKVSSGIYFYKMKSGNYSSTKKMILMK